jgi:hypothetical protein
MKEFQVLDFSLKDGRLPLKLGSSLRISKKKSWIKSRIRILDSIYPSHDKEKSKLMNQMRNISDKEESR